MKAQSVKVAMLSLVAMMLSGHVGASDWDHSTLNQERGQGDDGTYWATVERQTSPNRAAFRYPYAACAIGSHQPPIAINLTSNPIPISLNPQTKNRDNNPPAEPERHVDPLAVRYVPSISSTEGGGISKDQGNA